MLAGCAILLWHVLACVESPMAVSPQGDLAFTVVGPGDPARAKEAGAAPTDEKHAVSRLFVLPKGERTLRLIEATNGHYLCAPAYSPDGKTLSYLRVARQTERPGQEPPEPEQPGETSDDGSPPPLVTAEGYRFEDLSLPPLSQMQEFLWEVKDSPRTEVALVCRDAASGEVRWTTRLDIPLPKSNGDDAVIWTYTLGSMKHGPEGPWIYVCAGRLLLAIDPAAKQVRLLGAPVFTAHLSPDGRVVAAASENGIGLFETDGRRAVFARVSHLASGKGFAWLDDDTLAALAGEEAGRPLSLVLVRRDGTVAKSIELPIDKADNYWEELAISPDRKRLAVATKTTLYLLSPDGRVVSQWKEEGIAACTPVFFPDSQQLACKLVPEGDEAYCTAVAFFSLDGKELFRIDVPQ